MAQGGAAQRLGCECAPNAMPAGQSVSTPGSCEGLSLCRVPLGKYLADRVADDTTSGPRPLPFQQLWYSYLTLNRELVGFACCLVQMFCGGQDRIPTPCRHLWGAIVCGGPLPPAQGMLLVGSSPQKGFRARCAAPTHTQPTAQAELQTPAARTMRPHRVKPLWQQQSGESLRSHHLRHA